MARIHRHQLAHISSAAWPGLVERARDDQERVCLTRWAAGNLPLVVTQQVCGFSDEATHLALGIAAPNLWGRRRIGLRVPKSAVMYFDEFPLVQLASPLLPRKSRLAWELMCTALRNANACARVYGSFGWELITGLDHVRATSDIDLWVPVENPKEADKVALILNETKFRAFRLDGELIFNGDTAVSWREWIEWRAGRSRALMVKSIEGARLVETASELLGLELTEAVS